MDWQPIDTRPDEEIEPFLVLRPGNCVCDYLVVQVSNFEGQMYPDHADGLIDFKDRIIDATHWAPIVLPE